MQMDSFDWPRLNEDTFLIRNDDSACSDLIPAPRIVEDSEHRIGQDDIHHQAWVVISRLKAAGMLLDSCHFHVAHSQMI